MRKQRIWNKAHHHLCTTFLPPTYQSATILVKKTAKSRTQIEQTKQIKIDWLFASSQIPLTTILSGPYKMPQAFPNSVNCVKPHNTLWFIKSLFAISASVFSQRFLRGKIRAGYNADWMDFSHGTEAIAGRVERRRSTQIGDDQLNNPCTALIHSPGFKTSQVGRLARVWKTNRSSCIYQPAVDT